MKDATERRRNLGLAWPVDLAQQEDGSVLVTCPDIPEALTEGRSEDDALAQARDCLAAALGGYVAAGRAVPRPSPSRGRPMVAPPVLAAAKVALYGAMRDQGLGSDALAERLGIGEDEVRRLLDLDRRSPIGQVEAALHALGRRLRVDALAA